MEDFDKLKDNIEPLEKHGIKVCYYKEIYTQQRPQAFEVLFNLIKKYNIVIEQIEGISINFEKSLLYIISDPLEKLYVFEIP